MLIKTYDTGVTAGLRTALAIVRGRIAKHMYMSYLAAERDHPMMEADLEARIEVLESVENEICEQLMRQTEGA